MKFLVIASFWVFTGLFPTMLNAATVIEWEKTPEWVEPLDIPTLPNAREDQIDAGVFYAINDSHLHWQGTERLTYSRITMQVVTRGGLEEVATITRNYDPASDKISLLAIDLIRDGVRTSLKDRLRPQVFRRERNLDNGIIDGELTLHIDVPDVQVGDILDIALLYRTEPFAANLNHYFRRTMDWSEPEGITRVTVDWDKNWPLYENVTARDLQKTTQDMGEYTRYRWQRNDGDPVYSEANVPASTLVWGDLEITDINDWSPIVQAFAEYYDRWHPVPAGFVAEVSAIRLSGATDREKALRALLLVQDKIRYVGIEVGEGGYFARDPSVVDANNYGDCKDKAVLLKALLRAMNISSDVVLVHNSDGRSLKNRLPTLDAFNHMIVRVNLKEGPLFVDPTRSYEGGARNGYTPPNYHFGLPIVWGVTALQAIPTPAETVYRQEMTERFTFGQDSLNLDVETKSRGLQANWYRQNAATSSKRKYAKRLHDYYARQYPGLRQDKKLIYRDDRDRNTFVLEESYVLSKTDLFKNSLISGFGLKPDGLAALFSPPDESTRIYPLLVKHPYHYTHRIYLKNTPVVMEPPKNVRFSGSQFSFSFTSGGRGNSLWMRWVLQTHSDVVAPEQYAQWKKDVAVLKNNVYWEWNLTPPKKEEKPLGFLGLLQKAYEKANKDKLATE